VLCSGGVALADVYRSSACSRNGGIDGDGESGDYRRLWLCFLYSLAGLFFVPGAFVDPCAESCGRVLVSPSGGPLNTEVDGYACGRCLGMFGLVAQGGMRYGPSRSG